MPSAAQRRTPATPTFPLIGHPDGATPAALCRGRVLTAAQFLGDVAWVARHLPDSRHVLNACADRYLFAVTLCAAVVRGQVTLLPPTTTPNVIDAMLRHAPDAYFVSDDAEADFAMPRFAVPALPHAAAGAFDVPQVDGEQLVARVFTSGSTGVPQPHAKSWGALARNVGGEARRLGIGPGHTILGTVPAQHMYGFESTVLMPLVAGAVLTAERLFYPADIDAAIRAAVAPRTLFTTPFHLRAWLESGEAAGLERIVCATAPLSPGLAREAEARSGAQLLEIYGCTESGQVATRRPTVSPEWEAFEGLRLWNEGGQAMVAGGHVEQPTPLMDEIEPVGDGTRFKLHGRSADMVNIAGKRNSLGYLNHHLTAIPGVVDGTFFLPDEAQDGVTRLMAFVVAPTLGTAQVLAALRDRIDAAFLPRPLVKVEKLPRQLTGKLPRAALLELAAKARRTK